MSTRYVLPEWCFNVRDPKNNRAEWGKKFRLFITEDMSSYPRKMSRILDVSRQAVHHWMAGKGLPKAGSRNLISHLVALSKKNGPAVAIKQVEEGRLLLQQYPPSKSRTLLIGGLEERVRNVEKKVAGFNKRLSHLEKTLQVTMAAWR